MSSSIVKLIDSSIIPASLLILGKVLGLYLVINFLGIEWQINSDSNTLIGVYPVVFKKDIRIVSSYSDLVTLLVVFSGFGFEIFRSIFLHNSHIDPQLVVKLAKLDLLGLIRNSFNIYYKASVWFIFSFLALLFVIYNFLTGKTFFWVPILGIFLLSALIVLFIRDVEFEIEKSKGNLSFDS